MYSSSSKYSTIQSDANTYVFFIRYGNKAYKTLHGVTLADKSGLGRAQ